MTNEARLVWCLLNYRRANGVVSRRTLLRILYLIRGNPSTSRHRQAQ